MKKTLYPSKTILKIKVAWGQLSISVETGNTLKQHYYICKLAFLSQKASFTTPSPSFFLLFPPRLILKITSESLPVVYISA